MTLHNAAVYILQTLGRPVTQSEVEIVENYLLKVSPEKAPLFYERTMLSFDQGEIDYILESWKWNAVI